MIVKHNITAMNANRMLGVTTSAQAKSTEKLSSGYKINRAADDAAGLAISEKMRRQARGLTQASANAQDGISAVQTAEGALTEVHDMLQRMNELAIKAGNGTMSESDRQSVQNEIDQLITEIDRVSETTKFNETYLLKGSGENKNADEVSGRIDGKIQEAVITKAKGNIFSGTIKMDDAAKKLDAGTEDMITVTYLDGNGDKRTKDVTFKTGADAKATAANIAEEINKDKDLKKIFKASSDASGKLTVESKLNGTKTDATKNAVQNITFASQEKPDGAITGAAARYNQFAEGVNGTDDDAAKMRTAAVGESYALNVGKRVNDQTAGVDTGIVLKGAAIADGESITINGKTYTYDSGRTDSSANSFKSLQELQDLLGSDYEVGLQVSATKVTKSYVADGNSATATLEGTEEVDVTSSYKGAKTNDLNATIGSVAMTATNWTDALTGKVKPTNKDLGAKGDEVFYKDISVNLVITEKATVDKASDVLNFRLQVGADTTEENKISVDIESMSAKSLGIDSLSVTGKDSTNADEAVNTIADAIAKVSAQRSSLGAIQNRLEHTINNLDNVVENTTSAEAAIRDTDIATEMVKYANNNILQQAGTSMLSQANQQNQLALSLLG